MHGGEPLGHRAAATLDVLGAGLGAGSVLPPPLLTQPSPDAAQPSSRAWASASHGGDSDGFPQAPVFDLAGVGIWGGGQSNVWKILPPLWTTLHLKKRLFIYLFESQYWGPTQ